MGLAARTRELVAVSFVALSAGFAAGWWLARQDAPVNAPQAVSEHLELGARALQAGDLAGAERHFRDAAGQDPESPRAHADLAAVLMMQGRWEEARAALTSARRLGPDHPEVWFLEGMLWRDGFADTTRARAAWERFLALVPTDAPEAATVRAWIADLEGSVPPSRDPTD